MKHPGTGATPMHVAFCALKSLEHSSRKQYCSKFAGRAIACAIAFILTFTASFLPAQSTAAPQTNRILVKLRAPLAQQAEAEFPASMPPRQMHILPGQTGNARVKNFIRRHSGVELSPVYPEVIHARKQHGW